jgi:ribosomal protein S18 acetylase RimI-like enzyme
MRGAEVAVELDTDARLTPAEINAAYAWVEWPQREAWQLEAVSRSCRWLAARTAPGTDGAGELLGMARILDDGALSASLWDVIVRPDVQRRGIGRRLVEAALDLLEDRSLVAMVSTPAAVDFFAALGFAPESHGHTALYLRPHRRRVEHADGEAHLHERLARGGEMNDN